MDSRMVLEDLEQLAQALGLEIRYESLGDDEYAARSGRCRLRGREVILVDRRLGIEARIKVLKSELERMDLGGLWVKPYLRELLDSSE